MSQAQVLRIQLKPSSSLVKLDLAWLNSTPSCMPINAINGGIWWKAKIPPYRHTIAANGAAIVGLPSQIAYGGLAKNPPHHSAIAAMAPPLNNTDACIYRQLN